MTDNERARAAYARLRKRLTAARHPELPKTPPLPTIPASAKKQAEPPKVESDATPQVRRPQAQVEQPSAPAFRPQSPLPSVPATPQVRPQAQAATPVATDAPEQSPFSRVAEAFRGEQKSFAHTPPSPPRRREASSFAASMARQGPSHTDRIVQAVEKIKGEDTKIGDVKEPERKTVEREKPRSFMKRIPASASPVLGGSSSAPRRPQPPMIG